MPTALPFPLLPPSLGPASPIYLTGEDAIRLTAFNSAAGVTLSLRGRFLPAPQFDAEVPARVGPFQHDLIPATDRTASLLTRTLGEGWLLDWSVLASAGTPLVGQCYAVVSIVRGTSGNVLELSTISEGYVTAKQRLGGPFGLQQSCPEGGGALRVIAGATPGAGAEIAETVPANTRWDLIALKFSFLTAVAVANRVVRLAFDDGVNTFWQVSTATNQAASTNVTYAAGQGTPFFAFAADSFDLLPLPDNLTIGPGMRWRTVTSALQAADQYSSVFYLVRERIEGQ